MTEAPSDSTRKASDLAATIGRVTALAERLGRRREAVLDPSTLHHASGVPVGVIGALLRGESAGEKDIQLRFLQRLELLHRTHLKANGRKYSQVEIATETGISRQQISALFNNERKPTMVHCSQIERFFRRPAGWLQSDDTDALHSALLQVEKSLLETLATAEDPSPSSESSIFETLGVERIALRAALLSSDRDRQKVVSWLDELLQEEKGGSAQQDNR
ncbi:helix-turn-helix transcriptional regulator [Streptomyces sp. NPDC051130]|uniref:helix-turn-helix domain-containing protein n=1 Tax=Streptomyces sp. NPDC051130 TaxID=3157223 RepID=UPI0034425FBF